MLKSNKLEEEKKISIIYHTYVLQTLFAFYSIQLKKIDKNKFFNRNRLK